MRILAWAAVAVFVAVLITVGIRRWNAHRLKRVLVSFSEKYQDKSPGRDTDYEKIDVSSALFAEEELLTLASENKGCIVLTRDAKHADYRVTILVNRFVGDPDIYGEASLTITRANGDVVVAEHFFQDSKSNEDIARQPITAAWGALCGKGAR